MAGDRVRFRADPRGHITVPGVNVVEKRLIRYDRGGKLKQHVVGAVADVVHQVLIVATIALAGTGNP